MRRTLPFLIAFASLYSCVSETLEPYNSDRGICYEANLSIHTKTTSEWSNDKTTLNVFWQEGDIIWFGDDASISEGPKYSIPAENIYQEGKTAGLVFTSPANSASKVYAAYFGKATGSITKGKADVMPALDGSFSSAAFMAASSSIDSGKLTFKPVLGLVEFSIYRTDVRKLRFSVSGDAIPQSFTYDFSSDSASATAFSSSISISTAGPGSYYIPVMPGATVGSFSIELQDSEGNTITTATGTKAFSVQRGKVLSLGYADAHTPGFELSVPMLFKTASTALDPNAAGSAWPFKETKGSSSQHSGLQVFHTTTGGYPIFLSNGDSYPNSKGGLQIVSSSIQDYLEFPAFSKGRIKRVTLAMGSNSFSPHFTDAQGNTLKGGESLSSTSSGVLYTWDFTETQTGQPCRMVFGKASGIQIMQVTPTYEFDSEADTKPSNTITAVYIHKQGSKRFFDGSIGVDAKILGSGTDIKCGIQVADCYSDAIENKECTPDDFSWEMLAPLSDRYDAVAWASTPNGWREYSPSIKLSPFSFSVYAKKDNLTFKQQFSDGAFLSGASSASDQSGVRTKRVFADNEKLSIVTFAPLSGTTYYWDINTTAGIRNNSAGSTMEPLSYMEFPAIEGKALSDVMVTLNAGGKGTSLFVCKDPSSLSAAEGSMVSDKVAGKPGLVISLNIRDTKSGTAYCMVMPEQLLYTFADITAIYSNSEPSGAPAQEEENDSSADPTGVFDYSKLVTMGHPRLLIDRQGFADIRRKTGEEKASNVFLTDLNSKIIALADKCALSKTDVTYTLDASGVRLLEQSRIAFKQLAVLSYAYQVTGKARYLSRARTLLSQVCAFSDWHPSHFLDVAEMTLGVALAYDWLYNDLTLEERQLIHSRIVHYGLEPGYDQGFHESENNWNQVCNAGMIAGAIAVYEKDKQISYKTIEKGLQTNKKQIKKIYSPDGNYAEGYLYWGYGSGFQAILMKMLETAFGSTGGIEDVSGLDKTAGYMLFMAGPCGPFGYADGGTSNESASAGMWWFAQHAGDKSLLANEVRLYKAGKYDSTGDAMRLLPILPAVAKDFNIDGLSSTYPTAKLWSGQGLAPVCMVHTGWKFDETDHYLGIKAGHAASPHGHMDAGSFVYDALGQRWASELKRPTYDFIEVEMAKVNASFWDINQNSLRWDCMEMNNLGHSTISVNANDGSVTKNHPTDFNVFGKATLDKTIETASELGAVLNMSGPLSGQVASAKRTIKLVNEKDLVIIDEITALSSIDAPIIWRIINGASATAEDGCLMLTQGGKTMYLKAQSSDSSIAVNYVSGAVARPSDWQARSWDNVLGMNYCGFTCTIPKGKSVILTTTLSPEK